MKAKITIKLVRPTRKNRTSVVKIIESKKDSIINEVNNFIFKRVNNKGFIPVESFKVEIINYKNSVINSWKYKPTIR